MKTILVVDDDLHIGNFLEEALSGEGYAVAGADSGTEALTFDDITLFANTLTVKIADNEIRLTRTECAILKLLMMKPKIPLSRSSILDKISLDTPACTERSLKQHISNIRRKLQAVNGRDYIETVYGIGFKMKS